LETGYPALPFRPAGRKKQRESGREILKKSKEEVPNEVPQVPVVVRSHLRFLFCLGS
jgi:hypothetical protein